MKNNIVHIKFIILIIVWSCTPTTNLTANGNEKFILSGSVFKTHDQDCMPPAPPPCPDPDFGEYLTNTLVYWVFYEEDIHDSSEYSEIWTDSAGKFFFTTYESRIWIGDFWMGPFELPKKLTSLDIRLIDFRGIGVSQVFLNDTIPGIDTQ